MIAPRRHGRCWLCCETRAKTRRAGSWESLAALCITRGTLFPPKTPDPLGNVGRNMEDAVAVVLAAGMGTRMKSDLPKVLVPVLGRPMIEFVLRRAGQCGHWPDDRGDRLSGRRCSQASGGRQRNRVRPADRATGHGARGENGPAAAGRSCGAGRDRGRRFADDSGRVAAHAARSTFEQHRPACLLGTLHKAEPAGTGPDRSRRAGAISRDRRREGRDGRAAADHRSQHEHVCVSGPGIAACPGPLEKREPAEGVLPDRLPRHPPGRRENGSKPCQFCSRARL